jgi:hypothetical protein
MNELWVALIAAGAAIAGGAVTGWFTRSAGVRQAEAARHAGDRQADALLHTVQETLEQQKRAARVTHLQQAIGDFLRAVAAFRSSASALLPGRERQAAEGAADAAEAAVLIEFAPFAVRHPELLASTRAFAAAARAWHPMSVDGEREYREKRDAFLGGATVALMRAQGIEDEWRAGQPDA